MTSTESPRRRAAGATPARRARRGGFRGLALGALALLAVAGCAGEAAEESAPAAAAEPVPEAVGEVWFSGDFESGDLAGWAGDLPRPEAAEVGTDPVREGRYAVEISLAPGDVASHKERTELRLADKGLERRVAGEGRTTWYALSLLLPEDHADPPGGQYPIVAQWHHRPDHVPADGRPAHVTGPPPLTLYLVSEGGRQSLLLVHHATPEGPRTDLGHLPIERGRWVDLVLAVHWSTGPGGSVRAWLDGAPFTDGTFHGPTLYNGEGNYLRLGYYRPKGGTTTNRIYFDRVLLGETEAAVRP